MQFLLDIRPAVVEGKFQIVSDLTGRNFFDPVMFRSKEHALKFLIALENKNYVLWDEENDVPIYWPYSLFQEMKDENSDIRV